MILLPVRTTPSPYLATKRVLLMTNLKQRAKSLKAETYTLYLACRDPRTPWYAKVLMVTVVAYALSPIDLIPDFIPVLGYLDDMIIVPGGIFLALKMVPQCVLDDCRHRANSEPLDTKTKWVAATVIILVWLLVIYLIFRFVQRLFFPD